MDPRYTAANYTGYITVPTGDLDFMSTNNIDTKPVYNYFTAYNTQNPTLNYFNYPTFIKT